MVEIPAPAVQTSTTIWPSPDLFEQEKMLAVPTKIAIDGESLVTATNTEAGKETALVFRKTAEGLAEPMLLSKNAFEKKFTPPFANLPPLDKVLKANEGAASSIIEQLKTLSDPAKPRQHYRKMLRIEPKNPTAHSPPIMRAFKLDETAIAVLDLDKKTIHFMPPKKLQEQYKPAAPPQRKDIDLAEIPSFSEVFSPRKKTSYGPVIAKLTNDDYVRLDPPNQVVNFDATKLQVFHTKTQPQHSVLAGKLPDGWVLVIAKLGYGQASGEQRRVLDRSEFQSIYKPQDYNKKLPAVVDAVIQEDRLLRICRKHHPRPEHRPTIRPR
ncbi:MAG: hypothetical protein EBR02_06745 [Alphaproteobacteria bacterium]|nr:hypothetical protein [Alphaproteobacteria bacterium]